MEKKYLAYIEIKMKQHCSLFEETYTFIKPTKLYLPDNFIFSVQEIEKCRVHLNIKHLCDKKININKVLTLNNCDEFEISIPYHCDTIILSVKLLSIKTLKPCH